MQESSAADCLQVFDDLIDTFIQDVVAGGAQCAKHRKVEGIELKDIGLYMRKLSSLFPMSLCATVH